MSSSSKALVERVYSFLEKADLFVWDFSILMTMENIQLINWLAGMAVKNQKKILVSEEFYKCYSVVVKSSSAEQREIATNTKALLTMLKNNSVLALNSGYRTTESLVKALQTNPKVAFLVSSNSEAAELLASSEKTQAMILAITQEGKLCCCDREMLGTLIHSKVNDDKDNKFVIPVNDLPENGSEVKTSDGQVFTLGKEISSGAEGKVYFTDNKDYVCKIFHKRQLSVLRCKKLKYIENRQVRYDGICWPEKIVFSQEGKPVGYIMQRAYGTEMSKIFDGEESILESFPKWNRIDLVELSIKLLEKFIYLHLLGIKIGDIRPQNIVIGDDGSVFLIDMDSCQIEDYPCPFGDEDFTPAENQGKSFDSFLRTYRNERFSIFVLIFNVLFLGVHPYAQKNGAETIAEEIYSHAFPYPADRKQKCERAPIGGFDRLWNITSQELCTLFYSCFKEDKRPDIIELFMQLEKYRDYLRSITDKKDIDLTLSFESVVFDDIKNDVVEPRNINVKPIPRTWMTHTIDPPVNSVPVTNINQTVQPVATQNSVPQTKNGKKSKSTVVLWIIILVCLYLLVTFAMVWSYMNGSDSGAAFVKPVIDYFNTISLGG